MTVKKLIDKLMAVPNQNAEISVRDGCIIVGDSKIIYADPSTEDDLK